MIIIFPFSLDNIVVDLSTYASFTFSFVHELIDIQRPPTLLFFFPSFLRSAGKKAIWEYFCVYVPTYAYLKENSSCERKMTITFDSDDQVGGNLLVDAHQTIL